MRFWPTKKPSTFDRLLALMERRAFEEQEVKDGERDELLNEMYQALMAEEVEPEHRPRMERHLKAAEAHGWKPREAL